MKNEEIRKELEGLVEYLSSPCPNTNCMWSAPNYSERCYICCAMFNEVRKKVRDLVKQLSVNAVNRQ